MIAASESECRGGVEGSCKGVAEKLAEHGGRCGVVENENVALDVAGFGDGVRLCELQFY